MCSPNRMIHISPAITGRIHVVALHNHMIGEEPPFYFAHFWGKGPAKELAQGLKAALETPAKCQSAGQEMNGHACLQSTHTAAITALR
jgi:hypothetical protein